ncbi:hypothetical protein XI03_04695 [Bradyrhizobium sp. CCBAU 65884]|nr:hypothetical protein [Bradyrhizobium sp. CCBAU 65884]
MREEICGTTTTSDVATLIRAKLASGKFEMAIGFTQHLDFSPIIGWELYQVTIDKYHIMFWFENEHALLNVADRLSFKSSDGAVDFSYDIYGTQKSLNVDRILRIKVAEARIVSKDQLDLVFENGDVLSIYDNPEFRSWWFLGGRQNDPIKQRTSWSFQIGDLELEGLTEQEYQDRRI